MAVDLSEMFVPPSAASQRACPICRAVRAERERYAFWFYAEGAKAPATAAELGRSRGYCGVHTRLLLAHGRSTSALLPLVLASLAATARALTAEPGAPAAPCPVCASEALAAERAIEGVRRSATSRLATSRSRPRPVCPGHLRALFADLEPTAAGHLARMALADLRSPMGADVAARLAYDADLDVGRRGALPAMDLGIKARRSTRRGLQRLLDDLQIDACPACGAGASASARYLGWAAGQGDLRVLRGEVPPLCDAHLSELRVLAPSAAAQVVEATAAQLADDLETLLARVALLPSRGPWGRAQRARRLRQTAVGRSVRDLDAVLDADPWHRSLARSRRQLAREALEPARRRRRCTACAARDGAEEGEIHLLLAALDASKARRAYSESHGLCAQHVLDHRAARAHNLVRAELLAHTRILEWELTELGHQRDWSARHQVTEDPSPLLLAGFSLLDGHVFLGEPRR